jgi:predicted transcriptional regulator
MATTTIQLSSELKRTLEGLKIHPRETYSDVVERLIEDLKELDKATLAEIEEARSEIRAGRYLTQDQVRKALGF